MNTPTLGTRQKALALNLYAKTEGKIAESGGGQEVARWFFKVGGAAGSVSKTISAYDMTISDGIYARGHRAGSPRRAGYQSDSWSVFPPSKPTRLDCQPDGRPVP